MPSDFTGFAVDWYDASDSYATSIDITEHVKSIPVFTDTGTGEVNQATVVFRSLEGRFITAPDWVTTTSYHLDDRVKESNKLYVCLIAHTSGTFATDLAGGNWKQEPDFDIWDRFRIRVTDLGGNAYDRYFEMNNNVPSQAKSEGGTIQVNMLGIEYHTQQIHMAKPYYFEDAFTTASNIAEFYNDNKGTAQPDLDNADLVYTLGNDFGIGLPFYTANNYEFAVSEDICYNRWMDVIEKLGASVSAGGSLTFYEMSFDTTAVNAMDMKIRPSGNNTSGLVTIKNAKVTPVVVGDQEGELLNPTGSNVMAWGSPDHGTLPIGFSKYDSHLNFFLFRPIWVTGVDYDVGARIQVKLSGSIYGKHYECILAHKSGASTKPETGGSWATYWLQIDQAEIFGDFESYSPWTDDKATLWGNNGCDPNRATMTAGGWFDSNIVIDDNLQWFRTWVDARAKSDADLTALSNDSGEGYSYEIDENNRFPNGFRVLVDGTGTGDLSAFANQVVEYRRTAPTSYNWEILYEFGNAADADVKVQIAVLHEGKIYDGSGFNGTPVWTSKEAGAYSNDCFHPYQVSPTNVDGVDFVNINDVVAQRADITDSTNRPDITKAGGTFNKNKQSAVQFLSTAAAVNTEPGTWGINDDWYENGIGFNIRFPFPVNDFNGITESVGQLYGGGFNDPTSRAWAGATAYQRGDKVIEGASPTNWWLCLVDHTSDPTTHQNDADKGYWRQYFPEPGVFDISNMGITGDGYEGFNWGGSSESLGPINAVAFWLRLSRFGAIEWGGEHPFRCWFCDTKDNVVYQDFKLDHSNQWMDIRLPITGFRPYKAIKPIGGIADGAYSAFAKPNDVEVFNIFEWRNVKLGGVQYQGFYDAHGRYNPVQINLDNGVVQWQTLASVTSRLDMDGFRFVKPLLVTSGQQSDRNIEPDFLQRPNITLYHQLQNDAKSQLEIEKFKHKSFSAETSGDEIFDIRFGESFYLENPDIIDDADNGNNTIKLVAKRIEYSITKPSAGRGGIRRRILGAKVFT